MVRVEINEHTKAGRVLLALVKYFSENKKGVKILEETDKEDPWEGLQLTAEEKVFYGKFKEAANEIKALEAGEIEGRPLKDVLDEL